MSRHRAVRNLDLDDEMDDDYEDDDNYYDEDEDEDQDYGQDTHTVASFFGAKDVQNKPTARSGGVNLVEEVKAILGEGFSTAQIQQSLRENDNDLDSSVNWLLENGPSQAAAPPPGFKPLSSKPTGLAMKHGVPFLETEDDGLAYFSSAPVPIHVEVAREASFSILETMRKVASLGVEEWTTNAKPAQTVPAPSNDGDGIYPLMDEPAVPRAKEIEEEPLHTISSINIPSAGPELHTATTFPNSGNIVSAQAHAKMPDQEKHLNINAPIPTTALSGRPTNPLLQGSGSNSTSLQNLPSTIPAAFGKPSTLWAESGAGIFGDRSQNGPALFAASAKPKQSPLFNTASGSAASGLFGAKLGPTASGTATSSLFGMKPGSTGASLFDATSNRGKSVPFGKNDEPFSLRSDPQVAGLSSLASQAARANISGLDAIKLARASIQNRQGNTPVSFRAPVIHSTLSSDVGSEQGSQSKPAHAHGIPRSPDSPSSPILEGGRPKSQDNSFPSIVQSLSLLAKSKHEGRQDTTLTASPSPFALLLTEHPPPPSTSIANQKHSFFSATVSDTPQFEFKDPSPDDIVNQARSKVKTFAAKAPVKKSVPSEPAVKPSRKADLSQLDADMEGLNLSVPKSTSVSEVSMERVPSATSSTSSLTVPLQMARTASSSSTGRSSPKTKRVDVAQEYKKRNAEKESLNLVVVGHVDAGKSTLMGHLLFLLGEVNERTMKKFERDAEKMKKSSFAYAWVLDETDEERSRGVTIDVAITKFQTPHRKFTLLDAPGHRDFIPNMMSGASQADVAILVVDATPGEFETGFDAGGQTREHAVLIRSLGVSQLIVAVNKLDLVDWNKSRFDAIVEKLSAFLAQVGFRKQKLFFVPTSGFSGENLLKRENPDLKSWYSGPTLIDQIDAFEPPERAIDKHFRLSISDFFKGGIGAGGSGAVSVSGRIEAGNVQVGDAVLVMPINEKGTVRGLEVAEEPVKWAAAGDNVLMSLSGIDITHVNVGSVLCDPNAPIPVTTHIKAQIVTFEIQIPLTIGVPVVFHHQSLSEQATITKLVSLLNKSTGEVTKKNPRALAKNATAIVEIKTNRPLCIDTFRDSKDMGRFLLRAGPVTVAAGIVLEILSFEKGLSADK